MRKLFAFVLAAILLTITVPLTASAQRRIAVILVTFPTSSAAPMQVVDWARSTMTTTEMFYAAQSYQKFTLQGDVFGVYTVPLDLNASRGDVSREAKAAAIAAGVDLSPYSPNDFIYVSPVTNYVRAGYGDLTGVWIAMTDYPILTDARITEHELGHHLFGLNHAHGTHCYINGAGVSQCDSNSDYGDNLDVMGQGNGDFNILTKAVLGWASIRDVTVTGDYLLEPLETISSGIKGLRIPASRQYQFPTVLQYRGRLENTWPADPVNVHNGVEFHLALNGSEQMEINAWDPTESNGFYYFPALTVGQIYCNKDGKFSVQPLSVSSAGILVRVKIGAKCLQ